MSSHRRRAENRDELRRIPGVGPSIAGDLRDLGVNCISDLRSRDPGALYEALCRMRGVKVDRCVLYVFRCAVYFADHSTHDPELLKWWNWTDERQPRRDASADRWSSIIRE